MPEEHTPVRELSSATAHPHAAKEVGHPNPTYTSVSKAEPHRLRTTVVPGAATAASPTSRDNIALGAAGHVAIPPHTALPELNSVELTKAVVHPPTVVLA